MNRLLRSIALAFALCAIVASLSSVAFAADGAGGGSLIAGSSPGLSAGAQPDSPTSDKGRLKTATMHVALVQEGAQPTDAELGTPWDGLATAQQGSSAGNLSVQALNGKAIAKNRILKALLDVQEGSIDISDCGINPNDISSLYSSVVNSNPGLFYVSSGISYSYSSDIVYSITPSYNCSVSDIPQMKANYDYWMWDLLSWVPQDANTIQKAKAVHDWLVRNCSYNYDAANRGYYSYSSQNPWSAYGALVDKAPVCQGYSLAFKDAMNILGVPCGYLVANNHGWNIIQLGSSWFHVDATWDDCLSPAGYYASYIKSDYFMKSDQRVAEIDQRREGRVTHGGWSSDYHAYDSTYDYNDNWPTYIGHAVEGPPAAFALNATKLRISIEGSANLSIKSINPSSFPKYLARWSSSNPQIAAVGNNGHVVAGKRIGKATISCTINGMTRNCVVTVTKSLSTSGVSMSLPRSSYSYTGKAIKPTPTVKVNGKKLKAGTDYTVSYGKNTAVGTGTVTVTGKGYYSGKRTMKFTIAKAPSKVTLVAQTKTYNGKAQAYTGKVARSGSNGKVTYRYYLDAKCTKQVKAANVKGARTYYVKATVAANANYRSATSAPVKFTVRKAASKITIAAQRKPFTGKAVKYSGKVKRSGSNGKVTYRYYSDAKCTKQVKAANVKRMGTYYVKATVAANANFKAATSAPAKLIVGQPTSFVRYRTHVQNVGWQGYVRDGAKSGTTGRALRLEGINIALTSKPYSGGIAYRTHIQNIGWERAWRTNGAMSGTEGRALRLEAIQIKLTGEMARHYDVYYRVHCQNFGWMGWAKNGAAAGSAGYAYRLEAIQIKLVPKGGKAPGPTIGCFTSR